MRQLDRLEQALADFDRAIALKPDYADAHANRAACLDNLIRGDEALASYDAALALKPDHADAHLNRALNRLRAGDLKNGWVEAEWRWKAPALRLSRGRSNRPLWVGAKSLAGKTLLLHTTRGLGNQIQFCRYIPLLAERGTRVILEIDGSLKNLLSGVAGVAGKRGQGRAIARPRSAVSARDLPLAFDTTIETIPSQVPYISIAENAGKWEAFLGSTKRPRIGTRLVRQSRPYQ